ncbi:DEAD/DEAH box helicase [Candidatus Poribacteria bacterium]|nr:DEAD/DEAH box helicase [Candidatus Poribacteria bacterium]
MSIFDLSRQIIRDYARYVQSFLSINDERVRQFVEDELIRRNALWPESLLQLNPAYEMAETVSELYSRGGLHPLCAEIFCDRDGKPIRLYRHQQEAIERALKREHFVVTSGMGSGKTLTYFIPIFDAVLKEGSQEPKVRAIIVYPMNALVNSQYESLQRLKREFEEKTGRKLPVRFDRYTGQENREKKEGIQRNPPHILLTNYVMLELMLVRPEEGRFVDRATSGLEFLVLDELHTYRGRQGADVALLIRRLRERCGNPNLLCIGTSATMVAGRETTAQERKKAVADFASKIFGVEVKPENVIEERLRSVTSLRRPTNEELRRALEDAPPQTLEEMLENPLTPWIESTFGIEVELDGNLRRRAPISLKEGARRLAELTGYDEGRCEARLREMFLLGSRMRLPDGNPLFAFKLHRFISQGHAVYATLEPSEARHLTMEAQYYVSDGEGRKVLYPLLRSAIYAALSRYGELRYHEIVDRVVEAMGVTLKDIARDPDLAPDGKMGKQVWKTFRDLIEYRIYEDLRRGWRVVQPNLEQCGLLRIDYLGLDELCSDDSKWENISPFRDLSPGERKEITRTILDHFRRKLAINAACLREVEQQQLRRRVQGEINEQWGFEEREELRRAGRVILPSTKSKRSISGVSLSERSLIGRYLRRQLNLSVDEYLKCIGDLIDLLCAHGILRRGSERGVSFVQIDAPSLIWRPGDGPPLLDPIYSRRAQSPFYAEVQRRANEFFGELYRSVALQLRGIEGREHTAQISYEDRRCREERFRKGDLSCLFCSPTMELGIDISDLQIVHMRNVPPTPANYAQRSGRAGRQGDPALVMTYCSAYSGHDRYFFRNRRDMVAGAVRAPRLDLSNEDLIKAHVHAIWLARTGLPLGGSIADILDLDRESLPLKEEIRSRIELSENQIRKCTEEVMSVLGSCEPDLSAGGWYSEEWVETVVRNAPEVFDRAFDRWRELYHAAMAQLMEAQQLLFRTLDRDRQREAQAKLEEAIRQRNLLCNVGTTREESDFYPYRYLASEGFLPGYNFPRLPLRAFVPRKEGEFISRPRFLAITEFGPENVIYHEGAKYQVVSLISPPGGLRGRRTHAKLCRVCGYFHGRIDLDLCENCGTRLDGDSCQVIKLMEMSNVRTWRRERITCDEEERMRFGYDVTTHFRFAPAPGGGKRVKKAGVYAEGDTQLLRLIYAPTATIFRINHGWRNRREKGFKVDLNTGSLLSRIERDENRPPVVASDADVENNVRFFVQDTVNVLLIYSSVTLKMDEDQMATFQYALQRGIEVTFQVEESELASERIGSGEHRAILIWEAAEGGLGVLRRLVDEPDAVAQVARAALERCHFDPDTLSDTNPDCNFACYDCLLSYYNQRDHHRMNRHLVRDLLAQLSTSSTFSVGGGRSPEEHYRWLRSLTDSRSELERRFIDHLYRTGRRLPDEAQRKLQDYNCIPDFFYEPNVCVFCDGSVHDDPEQRRKDRLVRSELRDLGYRVIVIRYDEDLEGQISQYPDVFGASGE